MMTRNERRSLWMFILLIAIFTVPLFAAWWFVVHDQEIGSTSHGPSIQAPSLSSNNLPPLGSKQQAVRNL